MLLGIDHLVVAASDADSVGDRLAAALGLEVGGGGRHERLGTFNRLIWLGDSYAEIIGVFDAALAESSWLGGPVVRAMASGGGLATWAIATDDIDGDVERLRMVGARFTSPERGERARPDGQTVRWSFSVPARLDPDGPPFLIQHADDSAEWQGVDQVARAAGPGRLVGLEIETADLHRLAATMSTILGVPPVSSEAGFRFPIGDQRLDLRSATGPGSSVRLAVSGGPATSFGMAGCRWVVNAS